MYIFIFRIFLCILFTLYCWPVTHVQHRRNSGSIQFPVTISSKLIAISLARFSQLHLKSVFASYNLAWTAVSRIAVSQRQSFSLKPVRSLIDIRQTMKRSQRSFYIRGDIAFFWGSVHNALFVPIKCTRDKLGRSKSIVVIKM